MDSAGGDAQWRAGRGAKKERATSAGALWMRRRCRVLKAEFGEQAKSFHSSKAEQPSAGGETRQPADCCWKPERETADQCTLPGVAVAVAVSGFLLLVVAAACALQLLIKVFSSIMTHFSISSSANESLAKCMYYCLVLVRIFSCFDLNPPDCAPPSGLWRCCGHVGLSQAPRIGLKVE